jgi:hypothetical protein
MKRYLGVLMAFVLTCAVAAAAERAGVIEAVTLKDQDAVSSTVIVRDGKPLRPAVMMPLFAGDIVALASPQSVLRIVRTDDTPQEIRGPTRVTMDRSSAQGGIWDSFWWLWERIGTNEGEETPPNLISKGIGIAVPAAPAGGMILRGPGPVYLAWAGGTAPYRVRVNGVEREAPAAAVDFEIPQDAGKRLVIEIHDATGLSARMTLRLAGEAPAPPAELTSLPGSVEFRQTIAAAWLARQQRGRWRIEAMRRLRPLSTYEPAQRLLTALAAGR